MRLPAVLAFPQVRGKMEYNGSKPGIRPLGKLLQQLEKESPGWNARMTARSRRLTAGLLIAVACGIALVVANGSRGLPGSPQALDFRLPDLKQPGATISSADVRGRVVLVNVWASWCLACRSEHQLLLELSRSRKVEVFGFNFRDRREDALRWLAYYGDPFAASAFDTDGHAGAGFGVEVLPQTLVIDREGVIRHRHVGPIGRRDVDEVILPLVRQLSGGRT